MSFLASLGYKFNYGMVNSLDEIMKVINRGGFLEGVLAFLNVIIDYICNQSCSAVC